MRSLPEEKRGEPISAAYASNLEELIAAQGPALWVHGHIHRPGEYGIGGTRVLNNAMGYPGTSEVEERGFRANLVVEL